jgi:hypothetical protein
MGEKIAFLHASSKKQLICVEKGFLPNPRKVFAEGFC